MSTNLRAPRYWVISESDRNVARVTWQVRTTLLFGAVGPAIASLIVMTVAYRPFLATGTGPIALPDVLIAYVCFAMPVGYAFGVLPALLTGAMYCCGLTALPRLRPGTLPRAGIAALSGGLISVAWFDAVIGPGSRRYAWVAALTAALLSLRWPRRFAGRLSPQEAESEQTRVETLDPAGGQAGEMRGEKDRVLVGVLLEDPPPRSARL